MNMTPITQILLVAAILVATVWHGGLLMAILLGLALGNEMMRLALAMTPPQSGLAPVAPTDTGLPRETPNRLPPSFTEADE